MNFNRHRLEPTGTAPRRESTAGRRHTAPVTMWHPVQATPVVGKVAMRVETFNQWREPVQYMRPTIVVPRPEAQT